MRPVCVCHGLRPAARVAALGHDAGRSIAATPPSQALNCPPPRAVAWRASVPPFHALRQWTSAAVCCCCCTARSRVQRSRHEEARQGALVAVTAARGRHLLEDAPPPQPHASLAAHPGGNDQASCHCGEQIPLPYTRACYPLGGRPTHAFAGSSTLGEEARSVDGCCVFTLYARASELRPADACGCVSFGEALFRLIWQRL